ncbi:MAG: hypothetical protein KZQ95_16475 [Candidatus Thiodiazotropha sp. (ex Epidulcina cf. delphinae)]|nr:hypothetical protein [Candidatus Thiodiazotropha sp. (ex Epidulcina cf. delphinae)]
MKSRPRWDQCVDHKDGEVESFINEYFSSPDRSCLLIAGAGFDPRTPVFCTKLYDVLKERLNAIMIREERPNPDTKLIECAVENLLSIQSLVNSSKIIEIDIFAEDNAIIGGRQVISELRLEKLDSYTDIVIDLSALSIGVSFPIIRYVYESAQYSSIPLNIHLLIASDPNLDHAITPISGDVVNKIHGFKGRGGLHGQAEPAKLWLPQLSIRRKDDLRRIYDVVDPHDTCPILPFPSRDPTAGDRLAFEFLEELEDIWEVDTRNIVYADEENPLDLYRTILRIADERRPVFQDLGGSSLVLSPLGSKVLAVGALMAALELDCPVYYVEALGYDVDWEKADNADKDVQAMRHIWLYGDAYPFDISSN